MFDMKSVSETDQTKFIKLLELIENFENKMEYLKFHFYSIRSKNSIKCQY
jgi:hypothetical protein